MNVADEVTAAFWKEVPSFYSVFHTLTADDITIVPLFTARGYFTQTVIPAEMRLTGTITERDGKVIRYTRTLGEHAYVSSIVRQRVEEGLRVFNTSPGKIAVAIIGHSTRRNPESRKATEAQADLIRATGLVAEVVAVYLDDTPSIPDVYRMTTAPNLIAVPYFLASGSHTTIDVPARLGLQSIDAPGKVDDRTVYYTQPVGEDDELSEVILELAREAGMSLRESSSGSAWGCFPAGGRDEFIGVITKADMMRFVELQLKPDEVRVWGDESAGEVITTPNVLRERVREHPFRPLATAVGLRGGWCVPIDSGEMLHAVVETVYPGAIADWVAQRRGEFKANTLAETLARQTGNYRKLRDLSQTKQAEFVGEVCGACVRHPTWYDSQLSEIPCVEACNLWLSTALNEVSS
jgi:sirohydrochlorin cobaltochelatase